MFSTTNAHDTGKLNRPLDADGDGKVSAEEWAAEIEARGILGNTKVTTKHALAEDYPGATVKNMLGPRNPHMMNTPFTNVTLPPEPSSPPPASNKPYEKPTAASMFEKKLGL